MCSPQPQGCLEGVTRRLSRCSLASRKRPRGACAEFGTLKRRYSLRHGNLDCVVEIADASIPDRKCSCLAMTSETSRACVRCFEIVVR